MKCLAVFLQILCWKVVGTVGNRTQNIISLFLNYQVLVILQPWQNYASNGSNNNPVQLRLCQTFSER